MTEVAYKLVDRAEWSAARAAGVYAGSAVDLADGYIHLSTADQLAETARRHYAGRSDLVVVEVLLGTLGAALKWEASRGGDLFPHLHAPLPVRAARSERDLSVDGEGVMRFDDGGVGWP
ncbi:MAG: DUF952 domain-containing protein [Brevundimonas sp.]|uniref:DUF952 domain-containing protein n=1 Tax=Brevundimonas sp. TaxID=1871086 RepID=UPI00273400CE|nr:DUF952 domain-containing protein [Brevundimonas sp.]MDP3658317.1 DUF952 domain-containing protein [Brevundimonas sp.]MDZ4109159.1 DUF952 domain-containing protein [Brevundimonas sp.]